MDCGKDYIRMCNCEEVQNLKPSYKIDNWSDANFICIDSDLVITGIPDEKTIWLPRQDQLQEMLSKEYLKSKLLNADRVHYKLINEVEKFCEKTGWNVKYKSMEQLWLAFAMYELYQMKWIGTEWIGNK